MPLISPDSLLLLIDFQGRLMPAIDEAERIVGNAGRLAEAADMLGLAIITTEQNPRGLGGTVAALAGRGVLVEKMSFGACAEPAFMTAVAGGRDIVVAGCEAHVCVLQTVVGLVEAGRRVFVVQDAVGSRAPESKAAALRRMDATGAGIVTTEMVVFEWLRSAGHPQFRAAARLIR